MHVDRDAFFWQVQDGRLPLPRMLDNIMGPALACQLRAVGRVVRRGKDVCALSGELYQNDELVATATATALIRRM